MKRLRTWMQSGTRCGLLLAHFSRYPDLSCNVHDLIDFVYILMLFVFWCVKDDGILVVPTMPVVPPKLGSKEITSVDYQNRASSLLSIASISGCCQVNFHSLKRPLTALANSISTYLTFICLIFQVTVPLGYHEKCPVSVSFIGRHGGDRFLLDTVKTMYATLQEQSTILADPKSSKKTISPEELAEIAKEKVN